MNKFMVSKDDVNEEIMSSVHMFDVVEKDDHYLITKDNGFEYHTDEKDIEYEEIIDAYREYSSRNI